jgi:hypothetical protein
VTAFRLVAAAEARGELLGLLRAGLTEPVLAADDDPRAPQRGACASGAARQRALADALWRGELRWSANGVECLLRGCSRRHEYLRVNLRLAARRWRESRRAGWPRCCAAHHAWDGLMDWPELMPRHSQIKASWGAGECVPCGVLHADGSPYGLRERVGRIGVWQWRHLRPGASGRRFREALGLDVPLGPPRPRRPRLDWLDELRRLLR